MPNILRPATSTETVKLNSLKKKQLKQRTDGEASRNERRKDKKVPKGLRNVLHESHVEIDIDDPPISLSPETASTPANNYGALASTSTNLFQQEAGEKPVNLDVSNDQETPTATVDRDLSRVNQAFTSDLI